MKAVEYWLEMGCGLYNVVRGKSSANVGQIQPGLIVVASVPRPIKLRRDRLVARQTPQYGRVPRR